MRLGAHESVAGGAWNEAYAYERRVRAYARRRCGDRVIFLGTRSDIADLYADFDVVCHPRWRRWSTMWLRWPW